MDRRNGLKRKRMLKRIEFTLKLVPAPLLKHCPNICTCLRMNLFKDICPEMMIAHGRELSIGTVHKLWGEDRVKEGVADVVVVEAVNDNDVNLQMPLFESFIYFEKVS